MLKLDYDAAHRFVEGYPNADWEGWDILMFRETPAGATHRKGRFVRGKWGIVNRVSPNSEGKWLLRV